MSIATRFWTSSLAVLVLAISVPAEVPLITAKELPELSSHVLVGKVQRIYTSTGREGGYMRSVMVAELAVAKVEKGDGVQAGQVVYARYYNQRWVGPGQPPPGTGGHVQAPAVGDHARFFLQKSKDGSLEVVLPNGFETIK